MAHSSGSILASWSVFYTFLEIWTTLLCSFEGAGVTTALGILHYCEPLGLAYDTQAFAFKILILRICT